MRIWITDLVHPVLLNGLKGAGHRIKYSPKISPESVRDDIASWEGFVINSKIVMDRAMIERAEELRFIGRLGSGLDIIDLECARRNNIEVIRSPEGNRNAVAEHALGMLLSLLNHICRADRQVRHDLWEREMNRGRELAGSTVGIIGYGNNGRAFAQKLSGMDVEILAHDKYKSDFGGNSVREVSLRAIQQQADIISLHIPLTSETRHLVDREFLSKCQSAVKIVNVSRGEIIRTPDLIEGIESGKIAGACLDVFEDEPPIRPENKGFEQYEKLFSFENIIVSPHIAGWTKESKRRISEVLLQKIFAIFGK